VGLLLGYTVLFFLFFFPPEGIQPHLQYLVEFTFFLIAVTLFLFNPFLSGTGVLIQSILFCFCLLFAAARFSSPELLACVPLFIWLQAVDRNKQNEWAFIRQNQLIETEKKREKLHDKKEQIDNLNGKRLALARQIRRFSNLRNYITQINLSLSSDHLSDLILKFVSENLPESDVYTLSLLNRREKLVTKNFIVRGRSENLFIKPDQSDIFNDWVMTYRSPLTVKNTTEDYRFQGRGKMPLLYPFAKSIIASPLISDDKPMGLIRVDAIRPNQYQISDFRFLVIIANISALSLKNAELLHETEKLSITDGLTGLFRSHYLFQELDNLIQTANKGQAQRRISLLMMDLDHFKKINDSYGHVIGDQILIQSSRIIGHFCPKGSFVVRYGGEEFVMVLPGVSSAEAHSIAEKIRKSFIQKKTVIRREMIRLSLSIGVASFPSDAKDTHNLVRIADERLYKAKKAGRNQTVGAS